MKLPSRTFEEVVLPSPAGFYGSCASAIINPPRAGILSFTIQGRPVVAMTRYGPSDDVLPSLMTISGSTMRRQLLSARSKPLKSRPVSDYGGSEKYGQGYLARCHRRCRAGGYVCAVRYCTVELKTALVRKTLGLEEPV